MNDALVQTSEELQNFEPSQAMKDRTRVCLSWQESESHLDCAHAVRVARECARFGIEIQWTLPECVTDLRLLAHMPRPLSAHPDLMKYWPEPVPRYGDLYYRVGPGFVLIRDVRAGIAPARFTLDDAISVDTFLELQRPLATSTLSAAQQGVVDELARERIVYQLGDFAIALPIQMTRWPVPFNGV